VLRPKAETALENLQALKAIGSRQRVTVKELQGVIVSGLHFVFFF
jgi:hypothetical protein